MSGAHTPGPWEVNHAGDHTGTTEVFVYAPSCGVDDVAVASDIVDPVTSRPSEANARLIAAAPDLLRELQHAVRWFDQLKPEDIARYKVALAKAGSES